MTIPQENVVWITGASSGIGKSMAIEWVRLGYKVVLSSRRKELLDKVADDIKHSGGEALVIPCDIMEETAIENKIPFQRQASSRTTGTDTDAFAYANGGIPSALISIPLKYMHTTVEMAHFDDVTNLIRLVTASLQRIKSGHNFKYLDQ